MADGFGDKTDHEQEYGNRENMTWKEYRKWFKKNKEEERERRKMNGEGCTTL